MAPTTSKFFNIISFLMQEDNLVNGGDCNRIMILNIMIDWLRKVAEVIDWSLNSSHANSVENLWSIIKRRVEKQKPTNLEELNKFLHNE